jgi:hypothetical protein
MHMQTGLRVQLPGKAARGDGSTGYPLQAAADQRAKTDSRGSGLKCEIRFTADVWDLGCSTFVQMFYFFILLKRNQVVMQRTSKYNSLDIVQRAYQDHVFNGERLRGHICTKAGHTCARSTCPQDDQVSRG